jgi:hypothetical protein
LEIDCETCFTLFNRTPTSRFTPPKTTEEIRKSIYEFQNQLDQEERQMIEERKQRTAAANASPAPPLRPIILPEQLAPCPSPPSPLPTEEKLEIVIDPVEYEAYKQKRRAEKKEKQLLRALNTDGFETPTSLSSPSSNPVTPTVTNRKTLSSMNVDSPKSGNGLKNPLVWALNSGSFFFKAQPKPLRPQLQQFM